MSYQRICLHICLILALGPVWLHAQVIENFQQDREWFIVKADERKVSCQVADAPLRQGKSLKVAWGKDHAKYCAIYLKKIMPIEGFDSSEKPFHATITVAVFSPGTAEPSRLSIRIYDAENEVFQWMIPFDARKQGWQTVRFNITPDNIKHHWGGKKQNPGKLDGKCRLIGITLDFNSRVSPPDDAAKRQLFFDDITVILPGSDKPADIAKPQTAVKPHVVVSKVERGPVNLKSINVGLATGHRMHLVDPTSPQPAYLTLNNTSLKAQTVVLSIKAISFLGRTYELNQRVLLPAKKTVKHFLPLPQDKQDLWWVYYTLSDPTTADQTYGRELLGMMTPTGNNPTYQPQGRFLFGMCGHSERYDDQIMQAEAYASGLIGVDIFRGGVTWGGLQPTASTWQWDKMDRMVELYKQQNIEIQYLLAYTPRWATTGNAKSKNWLDWSRAAPQIKPWKNYVDQVTQHYRDDIRYWELWNEPDLEFFRGTAQEYVQMCKVAYPIIKQNSSHSNVLSGGWSGANRDPAFVDTALSGMADSYDTLAVHMHGFFGMFQKDVDNRWAQLRNQYARDKPLYFNETGISSPGDTIQGDTQQAVELVRKVSFAMSRGAMAYNWYDLRHDGDDPNQHEHRYGMITRDFQVKPAYMAYNNLIGQLRGYRFIKQITASSDQWLFLFEKDQQYTLVGWAQQPYAVGQLVLHSDAKNVKQVDMLGNVQLLPRLSDGGVVVAMQSQPAYWVFDKSPKAPSLTSNLIELPGVTAWIPGQANTLNFNFTNPLQNKADFVFGVQMPRSLGGASLEFAKTLPASKTVAMALPVNTIRGDVDYAQSFTCVMTYQDSNYQIKGSCRLPIQWAGVIRKGGFDLKPTFTIDQREQTFNLYRADPNNTHRVWSGPSDLSARTWLSVSDTHLKLRIEVKDDKHVQANASTELWKSDCIQLAMQVPGQDGIWEINFARGNDGRPMVDPGIVPSGIDATDINASLLTTTEREGEVVYELTLPLSTLKITLGQLAQGIYLSMLINDDDGSGRDGWIALSSGIGNGKDPSSYPLFIVR